MKHLEGLNDAQKQAVLATEGPLLVLAGAGAGKTRVITARVAQIIEQGVAPSSVLAVTFTNKAAKEMRERVLHLLSSSDAGARALQGAGAPFVSTFHSLGLYLIKENAKELNLPRNPAIYDRSDSMRAIKEAMKAVDVSVDEFEPRRILGAISKEKGNGVSVTDYTQALGGDFVPGVIGRVWEKYEGILSEEKALDFDDLLLRAVRLLREREDIRARYHAAWKYIEVDEYQDTNAVQNELAELLTGPAKNICAVGDIDQNIYSWRGAELKNILSFDKRFGTAETPARVILLEENYRSTQTILTAANDVIAKNKFRREKNLFTKNGEGDPISLYTAYDEMDEAGFVARRAAELIGEGVAPRDIAILFRANFQSRALEEAFLSRGLPYQVLGVRFFERREVKDVLSFLRLALGTDIPADLKRVANVPPRGIGKVTLLKMLAGRESELSGAIGEKVRSFRSLMSRVQQFAKEHRASETLKYILKESGLERHLLEGDEEDRERLENLRELVSLATRYDALAPHESAEALLEDAALASDQDELKEDKDAVKLMTVHAAKGLEFPYVFIVGLEEGLFPLTRDGTETPEAQEEERRLFYVALTRAKKKVTLTHAAVRTVYGSRTMSEPSSFISDIPENLIAPENPERIGKVIYLD